jgi:hypothetical protein
MTDPSRRILQSDTGDLHIPAVNEPDHERASILLKTVFSSTSVDDPLPGDRGAGSALGVNEATVPFLPHGISEAARNLWVIFNVFAALQRAAVLQVQSHMGPQMQSADMVQAGWDKNCAATVRGHCIDSVLDFLSYQGEGGCAGLFKFEVDRHGSLSWEKFGEWQEDQKKVSHTSKRDDHSSRLTQQ